MPRVCHLKYEVKYKPSYSMLVVNLDQGERITGESGAMTYMNPEIDVQSRMREGGILGTLGLTLFGKKSFFVNDYIGRGEVAFVAAPVGDIEVLQVAQTQGYIIQKSAYLA
jgi:uncharacterized protein (AIM24 family)